MTSSHSSSPPWKRPNPRKKTGTHLTPAQKAAAKRSADEAGRPYPNLVDNLKVLRQAKDKTDKKEKS